MKTPQTFEELRKQLASRETELACANEAAVFFRGKAADAQILLASREEEVRTLRESNERLQATNDLLDDIVGVFTVEQDSLRDAVLKASQGHLAALRRESALHESHAALREQVKALSEALRVAKERLELHGYWRLSNSPWLTGKIDAALALAAPPPANTNDVCDKCGGALVHVAGPKVNGVLCPVCDADSSALQIEDDSPAAAASPQPGSREKCEDCPPSGYPTDKTRCDECPLSGDAGEQEKA